MSKARVEAFSDGVIAIAVTLLVLDIHVPDPAGAGSLGSRLAHEWPSYVAYVVSFLTIGIIWINHSAMLRRIVAVDHSILFLNLLLLMTIAVLPFTTALMAAYLKSDNGQHLAAVVYGGSYLAMAVAFFVMHRHLLRAKVDLLDARMTADVRRRVLRRNAIGLVPYAIATVAGIVNPYITLVICAVVAAFYALPGTTSGTPEDLGVQ
jgi:uncharacterized membrane protein